MSQRMTWTEITKQYPDEWVLLVDYELTEFGEVKDGILLTHSPDKEDVFSYPTDSDRVGLLYTGESTFRGFRSHAARDYV